jgi:hypothetical protein
MKKVILGSIILVFVAVAMYRFVAPPPGPGMTVGFDSAIYDKKVEIVSATLPNGEPFTFSGLNVWPLVGKSSSLGAVFVGASSDGRNLPEWVDFEWKEWPYPSPQQPSDAVGLKEWAAKIEELDRTLPHKRLRVNVRRRIPKAVIDEAIAAVVAREYGKLPEKQIWIYFVWHPNGIWFVWRLKDGTSTVRSGGDEIPQLSAPT